jgi:hypothetical protein
MRHAWKMKEECKRFCWESPKEIDHSKEQGIDQKMESEWILGTLAGEVWSGFSWLRIGTCGRLL